jgi:hypothetical protein
MTVWATSSHLCWKQCRRTVRSVHGVHGTGSVVVVGYSAVMLNSILVVVILPLTGTQRRFIYVTRHRRNGWESAELGINAEQLDGRHHMFPTMNKYTSHHLTQPCTCVCKQATSSSFSGPSAAMGIKASSISNCVWTCRCTNFCVISSYIYLLLFC